MESKLVLYSCTVNPNLLLIEPVWNRNLAGCCRLGSVNLTFNRTSMESKLAFGAATVRAAGQTFNRTSMESKPMSAAVYATITALLIEPVWNRNTTPTSAIFMSQKTFNRTSMESKLLTVSSMWVVIAF